MHYDPKCIKNKHKCQDICISVICKTSNPFVCTQCHNPHDNQTCQVIPYRKLVRQFHKIQGLYTNQILKFQQRVENTFNELMNHLKMQFMKFRQQFQYLNVNDKIKNIYDKIKNNKENELTAQTVHWAMKTPKFKGTDLKVKDELQMRLVKQEIIDKFAEVIKLLPPFYSLKKNIQEVEQDISELNEFQTIENNFVPKRNVVAGIMNEYFSYLKQMINQEIYNVHLLYKASEHKFSAEEFHKRCDGMSNTITIAKTQYDKIVIGFSPFPWESPAKWVYKQDNKQQCFLISPHKDLKGKKFTVMKPKFAIGMHKDYGPSFGDDFVIYDKAQNSKSCWSNFPDVYNFKTKPFDHSIQVVRTFVGVKDHFQKFNLDEWQVYKVSFNVNDNLEMENSYIKQYKKIY